MKLRELIDALEALAKKYGNDANVSITEGGNNRDPEIAIREDFLDGFEGIEL